MADKSKTLYCSCGCLNGVCVKNGHDAEAYLPYINLVCDADYTVCHGFRWRTKSKVKRLWDILRDKEVSYFDIIITKEEDLDDFKAFVASLDSSHTGTQNFTPRHSPEPIYCSAGCIEGMSLKAERDPDCGFASIELVLRPVALIYDTQRGKAKEILKRTWYVIISKEYKYFEIWMSSKDEADKFKEFVAKI